MKLDLRHNIWEQKDQTQNSGCVHVALTSTHLQEPPCLHGPHKYLKCVMWCSTDHLPTGVKGQTGELHRPGGGKGTKIPIPERGREGEQKSGGGGEKLIVFKILVVYRLTCVGQKLSQCHREKRWSPLYQRSWMWHQSLPRCALRMWQNKIQRLCSIASPTDNNSNYNNHMFIYTIKDYLKIWRPFTNFHCSTMITMHKFNSPFHRLLL